VSKYGQYCPIARALEMVGDRWTLLILRDMLFSGSRHFNDLERGLPGISRALLASRLRQLQKSGLIDKGVVDDGRSTTEYQLTRAGQDLIPVLMSLRTWGEAWAFGEPQPEELDPILLMWWLRGRVDPSRLPEHRVVIQYDFFYDVPRSMWLVLTRSDVAICLTDPGFEINLVVTADLPTLFKLARDRISYPEAIRNHGVVVDGSPRLVHALPDWFGWSGSTSPARASGSPSGAT
jgi:DNA-binding HxlR family transcriptional regulator